MVDSGIKCDSSCTQPFCDLEKKRLEYVIMAIEKVNGVDKVVIKEESKFGDSQNCHDQAQEKDDLKGATPLWARFTKEIKKYPIAFGCCYITYNSKDSRDVTKLPFIFWCTDQAKIGDKMIYSATKIPTSRKITTVSHQIQCSDDDEICYKEIVQKVSRGDAK